MRQLTTLFSLFSLCCVALGFGWFGSASVGVVPPHSTLQLPSSVARSSNNLGPHADLPPHAQALSDYVHSLPPAEQATPSTSCFVSILQAPPFLGSCDAPLSNDVIRVEVAVRMALCAIRMGVAVSLPAACERWEAGEVRSSASACAVALAGTPYYVTYNTCFFRIVDICHAYRPAAELAHSVAIANLTIVALTDAAERSAQTELAFQAAREKDALEHAQRESRLEQLVERLEGEVAQLRIERGVQQAEAGLVSSAMSAFGVHWNAWSQALEQGKVSVVKHFEYVHGELDFMAEKTEKVLDNVEELKEQVDILNETTANLATNVQHAADAQTSLSTNVGLMSTDVQVLRDNLTSLIGQIANVWTASFWLATWPNLTQILSSPTNAFMCVQGLQMLGQAIASAWPLVQMLPTPHFGLSARVRSTHPSTAPLQLPAAAAPAPRVKVIYLSPAKMGAKHPFEPVVRKGGQMHSKKGWRLPKKEGGGKVGA